MCISLADGQRSTEDVLITTVTIEIEGRKFDQELIALPNAKRNRTLLGIDFLKKSGIMLDLRKQQWFFADMPQKQFAFGEHANNQHPVDNLDVNLCTLREEEVFIAKVTPMGADKRISHRNFTVDFLIVLFGICSWVAVNGLWVELPELVNRLPEKWQLASYIVITSQIANLGPILFSAARKIWSQKVLEVPIIHASLAIVIAACVLLSIFWDSTTFILGELHSTALLILAFFLAFVDCTSSLLYLPFIANFKEQYVISYLIGSGLSGPIPGLVAMAQGVGGYTYCKNVTITNSTEFGNVTEYILEPDYPLPRFSPNVFFGILSGQMVISWIAFILLNCLHQATRERVSLIPVSRPSNPAIAENFQTSTASADFSTSIERTNSSQMNLLGAPGLPKSHYYLLLFIQGFLSTIHNGVLLSIQVSGNILILY
ncbi:solute carrier family 52, riboflavin transporter, member 3-A [Nephila pilipes]|uniref:Riboflavin transporter n=1 Tax=Nephila pilipes TaxID=299642 RepID=A0A8X6IGB6_NEPPI|nr:solute carrier family 52, riboflavin transporter, member 3-A [Nephila pilipes]